MTRGEAERFLIAAGKADDEHFPLFEAAIACALHETPHRDATAARALASEGAAGLRQRLKTTSPDHALAQTMAGDMRLTGDRFSYDDLDNADIVAVAERRRGLPVALGIYYLDAARRCGASLHGIDFPGHFLLRLATTEGIEAIDPFCDGSVVTLAELTQRAIHAGLQADDPGLCEALLAPITDRAVLLRLQNNILTRALAAGDHAMTERAAVRRAIIDPGNQSLWFDVASVRESQGSLVGALEALHNAGALDEKVTAGARALRERVRRRLN